MNQAPLYVYAHDFAVWMHARVVDAPAELHTSGLPADLADLARSLLSAVALALTFPASRREHLRQADETIARLKVTLRVGEALGWLSTGGVVHAVEMLESAGRLVGGWRKRVERSPHQSPQPRGQGD